MTLRTFARNWLPPAVYGPLARAAGQSVRFATHPAGWASALAASNGYSATTILERVAHGTREVLAGRAIFERDSVLFNESAHPFQMLAPLLRHAIRNGRLLEVIDFGGSLGSSYRQCRSFIPDAVHLRWHVVEQAGFVALGTAEFSTDELHFHASLDELPAMQSPPLLLASSVIQYLEDPHAVVNAFGRTGADTLVVDRTPVSDKADDVLCIQRVPPNIYDASYPCWILSRTALLAQLHPTWKLIEEFPCPEGRHVANGGPGFEFKGFILERARP